MRISGWYLDIARGILRYMAESRQMLLRMSPELWAAVEDARGDVSRSVFVRRALEARLYERLAAGPEERPFGVEVGDPEKLVVERAAGGSVRGDAGEEYARMMRERQGRLNRGRS